MPKITSKPKIKAFSIKTFAFAFINPYFQLIPAVFLFLVSVNSKNFFGELFISFLPYLAVILLFWILLTLFIRIRNFAKIKLFSKNARFLLNMAFFLNLAFFCRFSYEVIDFYYVSNYQLSERGQIPQDAIKVFSANILYRNQRIPELLEQIKQIDADVLVVYEDNAAIGAQLVELNKIYEFQVGVPIQEQAFSTQIYSKYPITNFESYLDFPPNSVVKVNMLVDSEIYSIIAAHPIAPMRPELIKEREKGLMRISKLVESEIQNSFNKIIVVGDLNTSPWSYYYKQLVNEMRYLIPLRPGNEPIEFMQNITTANGHVVTWRFILTPFMQTHIDHIFVSNTVEVFDLELVNTIGSDHKGWVFWMR